MNHPGDIQEQIQRLVDNELNAEQTTALLQHCEQQPTAWRMLALGLLESRELKVVLSEMLGSTEDNAPSSIRQQHSGQTGRWVWHGLLACLTVAAFVAGLCIPKSQQGNSLITNSEVPNSTVVNSTTVDPTSNHSVASNKVTEVAQGVVDQSESDADVPQSGLAVVGYAQILHQVGSEPPIPVITGPDLDYSALLTQQRRIPESIARQYRNEGLVVENQRRVMSLQLADGQQFAIPLDQLGVRYVGNELL